MRNKILLISLGLLLVIGLVAAGCAPEATPPALPEPEAVYPSKTITLIVPYKAGGGTDRWARIMAGSAIDYFGQPWRVVNIPGASAIVGWKEMLSRPADGYTLYMSTTTPIIALLREEKPPLSPFDAKVTCLVSKPRVILLSEPGAPWATWESFKTFVQENPGELTLGTCYASLSPAVYVLDQAGIADKVAVVPYDSTADLVADFLGGHLDTMITNEQGTLAIVPENATPLINFVDAPTTEVKGLESVLTAKDLGYETTGYARWIGVHPDTPDEIVESISEKMGGLLEDVSLVTLMEKLGEEVNYTPSAGAQAEYKEMVELMEEIFKEL